MNTKIIIDLLIISNIIVLINDISGFQYNFKKMISKLLTKGRFSTENFSIKPFDCSLCLTFWIGLFYLIFANAFNFLNLFILLLVSVLGTNIFKDIYLLILQIWQKIISKLYD